MGSLLPSKLPPFWFFSRSKSIKKSIRNRTAQRSLQDRPKTAQDPPKMPPGPLRRPQDALPDTLGRPKNAPRCPPETPRTTQNAFRSIWANILFHKNLKSRNRRKHVKKKSTTVIHGGHPHPSSQKPKALSKRSEPRGWRRWSREALFNPPPPAQHGVL